MSVQQLAARLPEGALRTDLETLASKTRDWWALGWLREARGDRQPLPAAVVSPASTDDVVTVLEWAHQTGTPVVPRGGGSGVAGGAVARGGEIVLDLTGMSQIVELDLESMAVTAQAGVMGGPLEEHVRERGLTLGHYPQSLALSTVGGWIATGAVGHASTGYGAIEDMLLGLTAVLPGGGVLRLRPIPRSAAGPDLRRLFVGSEGTLGVVTEATLALARMPESYRWLAYRLTDFADAMTLCRQLVQAQIPALIVRTYDEADAALTFQSLGFRDGCVLIIAFDAGLTGLELIAGQVAAAAGAVGAEPLPGEFGVHWWDHHTDAIGLYEQIMGAQRSFGGGVVVDTVEMAAVWRRLPEVYRAVREVLAGSADMVGCHLSHLYTSGASLYFTVLWRGTDDLAVERVYLDSCRDLVAACHEQGGTMTHHHGVGLLRTPFLAAELGDSGLELLRAVKRSVDPLGIMNPGKLIGDD